MSSSPAGGAQEAPKREPIQKFKGHTDYVSGVIHLPDGQRIITCSWDGSLRLWNLKNGLQIGKNWEDGKSPVYAIALSPDGKTVVSGGDGHAVRLWDIETGKVIAKWTGHSAAVWSVCWSGDGRRVVSGSEDTTTKVWNVENGEVIGSINSNATGPKAVAYSLDNTMIATGEHNGIKIWDAKTFELRRKLTLEVGACEGLAWAAGVKAFICGSHNGSIATWNTTTWKQTATLTGHSGCVFAIAISPNNRILASASIDSTARLWNLANGQPIGLPLQHPDQLRRISFSTDGGSLTTGCTDHNAYTWDVTAIVKEAGFDDLLVDSDTSQSSVGKYFIDVDTTLRPARPLNSTSRLPQGFFDDTSNRIHSSSIRPSSGPQSSTSRFRLLFDRVSHSFRHSDPAERDTTSLSTLTPSRTHNSTLAHFSRYHDSDNERGPREVEVPCTRGLPRNIKVVRQPKKETPIPINIMNIHVASTSRPSTNDIVQQSSEAVHTQQPSPPMQVLPTMTHVQAVSTTTSAAGTPLPPNIVIKQAGCWVRFWLSLGCISAEDEDNH